MLKCILDSLLQEKDFLSDIAAFEAAVVSFLIPLFFGTITTISKDYGSLVISKMFLKEWEFLCLPWITLCLIVVAVSLRMIPFEVMDQTWQNGYFIIAPMVFISFFVSTIIVFLAIRKLKVYSVDRDYVTKKLEEQLFKELENE